MFSELVRRFLPPAWITLAVGVASLVIQLFPEYRHVLLYDRTAIAAGEFWRIWTGHLVHFGWSHFIVDTGLLLIVGNEAEKRHPSFAGWAFPLMPVFISAALYWCVPHMERYGGLSAFNLGLLLYIAAQGWRKDWTDWFWPAVIAIYLGELIYEYFRGGHGGGAIRFDDASVQVATGAHVASTVYALLALAAGKWLPRSQRATPPPSAAP